MNRFKVRKPSQSFNDRGPDLLRPVDKAATAARRAIPLWCRSLEYRIGDGAWKPIKRKGFQWVLGHWATHETLMVIRRAQHDKRVFAVLERVPVTVRPVSNCSPGVALNWALVRAAFPTVLFGGGYVYKEIAGTSAWSDHAWGTAFDSTPPNGSYNDRLFDWTARMRRARCMTFDYALGSRGGRVVKCYASGLVLPSSADSSHLWHVHQSVVDHGGARPPRPGGVW